MTPNAPVQAAAEGLPETLYAEDQKAYRLFGQFLEERDEALLVEALDYSVVRLGTIMEKARVLVSFTYEEFRTSDVARSLAISLARNVVKMDGKPVLHTTLPAIEGEREREIAHAYLEWLHMERRILASQIWPGIREADRYCPGGTLASSYHFPLDRKWHDAPMPSTRAEGVLRHVGVDLTEADR